ncbi:MAG: anthranilate synthase component II [Sarcina sp.]
MILIIDNYDSFVYNIYQAIGEFAQIVKVYRNDEISIDDIRELNPNGIVISPGPGKPSEVGMCFDIIKEFENKIPILGVCLGHQVIGEYYGAKVIKNTEIVHGKVDTVKNLGSKIFEGVSKQFKAMRYHSLIIDKSNFSDELEVISELSDGTIMGVKHKQKDVYGVQFHPESIGTICGKKIIENFVRRVCDEDCRGN